MNTFQALVMAVESRLSMANQAGSSHIAYTCETLIDIAKHFNDRLAALERAEDRKKSPSGDPMDRKIVPIDGAIEAARHAKPDPRKQYAIADLAAIKAAARDEALEEAAKLCERRFFDHGFLGPDETPAAIRALKSK